MFTLTIISFVLLITTMVNIGVTYIAWKRKINQSNLFFALGMIGISLWSFASALDYAAIPLATKIFFAKLEAIGYHSAFALFAVFSMYYAGTDRWLRWKWVQFLFFFIPVSNILLTLTNELHGWIWSGFTRYDLNVVDYEHGIAFNWVVITSYALLIFIFINLWIAFRKGSDFTRRQARIVMFALVFPIAFNLLYRLGAWGIKGIDWTSVTFSITSILILYALYGLHFLDIVPVARGQLVSSMVDGMIVVDTQNRIIDINPAAERFLGVQSTSVIGRDLGEIKPLSNTNIKGIPTQEFRLEFEHGETQKGYFEATFSPLHDERGKKTIGQLILFRDITERKENELRLLKFNQAVEKSPVSIVITDPQGNITYVNSHFIATTGYSYDEAVGNNPRILKSGFTPAETYQDMWQTILGRKTWRGEFLNRKKNGELYWEDAITSPIMDPDGNIVSLLMVKVEITERKKIEQELQASEERFRTLVTSAPDAVFGVDHNGRIVFANLQASSLLGYGENELLNLPIDTIVPDHLKEKHASHRAMYAAKPHTRSMGAGMNLVAKRKDGSALPVDINLSYFATKDDSFVIAFMRDITERRRFEMDREVLIYDLQKRNIESESLRETTAIVTSAIDFSEAIQLIMNQLKRVIAYDSASVWIYEGETAHMIGGDGVPDLTEEEKRYTISPADPDYPLIAEGYPYVLSQDIQINYPVFRKPPINYIHSWMAVPLKVQGRITGFISLDGRRIGQFTHADAQLALNYADQVSIALEKIQLISNLKDELDQGQNLIQKLDAANANLAIEVEERKQAEAQLQNANIQLKQQVEEIQLLQTNMRELAIRDSLTGLHNRHFLHEALAHELARAKRERYFVSFLLVDIDHFKKVNDTFGHATGDVVLKTIARQFQEFTRDGDILVRYGGEEFLLVLPNRSKAVAAQIAERLRVAVQRLNIEDNGSYLAITISCGISEFPTDSNKETQVLALADKALYAAKNGGRNQVVSWSDTEHDTNHKP